MKPLELELHGDWEPKHKLWPTQVAGIEFLSSARYDGRPPRSAILGDEVGLGKTLQAIRAVQAAKEHIKSVLVICPLNRRANLKHWWAQEIEGEELHEGTGEAPRWGRTVELGELYKDTPMIKVFDFGKLVRVWVLAHYEQLLESHSANKLLRSRVWDLVLADEVHKAKNQDAQRTQGLWDLKTKYKWGLTGTPVAEFPPDLWALLHWVAPDVFRYYWDFVRRYTYPDYGYRAKKRGRKPRRLKELREHTKPWLLVRRRGDAGIELPPLVLKNERVSMTDEQRAFYKEVSREAMFAQGDAELAQAAIFARGEFNFAAISAEENVPPIVISGAMARFTRLHQVASDPRVFRPRISGGKEDWLRDFVENGGGPAVIMTRYVQSSITAQQVLQELAKSGDVLQDFNPDDWIVGTYAALSEGHNLQRLHQLIAWDSTWERRTWEQAIGRIDRPGQLHSMIVYRLLLEGSVDFDVADAIDKKMTEVDMIIQWLRRSTNGR